MKKHEFEYAARQFRAGKLRLDDFTEKLFPASDIGEVNNATSMEEIDALLDQIRDRKADSHKGDYGRVLIIAGSPGMAGAAALAGMAALRTGAGTVTVSSMGVSEQVAGFHPAIMTKELGDLVTSFDELCEHFSSLSEHSTLPAALPFDVVGIGPGLGVSRSAKLLVQSVIRKCPVPVVVDADAINNLDSDFEWSQVAGPRVLTPHPGELKRLMPEPADCRQQQAEFAESIIAANQNCVVALKGSGTLVIDSSGTTKNESGNPGMATAGSGDVFDGNDRCIVGSAVKLLPGDSIGLLPSRQGWRCGRQDLFAASNGCHGYHWLYPQGLRQEKDNQETERISFCQLKQ